MSAHDTPRFVGNLRSLARDRAPMKVLMVSWEYPPVVIGGLGRHVYHLATALAAAGHEVVVLSRRPSGTDPSTHPSTDEIAEGVRVVAAAQDPHEFDFGTDMMAWTLAMGHSMVRAGLAIKGGRNRPWRPDVVHAHDWLVAHPGDRARRILRRPIGFHHSRHRGRQAFGLGVRSDQPAGARRRVVAGSRIRFAHHVFGVDERRDHRVVRTRTGRDAGDPQRNRRRAMAVREAAPPHRPGAPDVPGTPGVREGHSRRDRRAAPHQAHPPGHDADDRR